MVGQLFSCRNAGRTVVGGGGSFNGLFCCSGYFCCSSGQGVSIGGRDGDINSKGLKMSSQKIPSAIICVYFW